MTTIPETKYALSGDISIAYQVLGEGDLDVVYVPPFISNLELYWESKDAEYFRHFAKFCRLILFDKRGTGLSDRTAVGTLEERMDDIRAVMDAAGSKQAAIVGISDGGPISVMFTATYPERVKALVLYGTFAYNSRTPEQHEEMRRWYVDNWGSGEGWTYLYDHLPPEQAQAAASRAQRLSASPGGVMAIHDLNYKVDVRHILPSISVPTLVLHKTKDQGIQVEGGRYIAKKIPGAELRELEGTEHFPQADDWETTIAEIEEFLTGVRPQLTSDRVLATVLFTDIVDSTLLAGELGDERWLRRLKMHDDLARREIARFRGRLVKLTGDGILATFDGPARAVSCAASLRDAFKSIGITIRAGVHTGECELSTDDVGGIAVNIARRVCDVASSGEIFVSRTVTDLVAGSGLDFEYRGERELRSIAGHWQLYSLRP